MLITSRRLDIGSIRSIDWPMSRDWHFYEPLDFSVTERTIEELVNVAIEKGDILTEQKIAPPASEDFQPSEIPGLLTRDMRHKTEAELVEYNTEGLSPFRRALALAMNAVAT